MKKAIIILFFCIPILAHCPKEERFNAWYLFERYWDGWINYPEKTKRELIVIFHNSDRRELWFPDFYAKTL
jgi:hypothetical protein